MKHCIIRSPILRDLRKCADFAPASIITGLLNTGVEYAVNQANMSTQNKYNMKMLKAQNEFTEHMYDKNNAYNTPAMQRQRMLDAGLNPILLGVGATGQQATAMSSGSGGGSSLPSASSNIQNPQIVQAQLDNLKADTLQKQSNASLTDEQKKNMQMNNWILENTKDSTSAAQNAEHWQKFYENNAKIDVLKSAPDVVKTAYLDTWRGLTEQTLNIIADKELKHANRQYIDEQKKAINTQLDLAQQNVDAILRGQDVNKAIAEMNNATALALKKMDVMIAEIAKSAGIEVAKIQSDLSKDFSNMLQPIFDLGQVKVEEFTNLVKQGKSLYEAFKIVSGVEFKKQRGGKWKSGHPDKGASGHGAAGGGGGGF